MTKEKSSANEALINDYASTVVPQEQRKPFVSNAAVWYGFTVSISAFLTGGTLGAGLSASKGILAVIIGNAVLVVIACLLGVIGCRLGLTTASLGRIVFGKKGSVISSVVLGVLGMCLIGVLMNSFGDSVQALIPGFPGWLATIIFACCITSSAIFGYKGLTVVSFVAVPSLLILLAISLIRTGSITSGGLSSVMVLEPVAEISMATGISNVISTWANGACLSADISRYAKKPSHVVGSVIFGFVVGTSVFEGCAVLMSLATGAGDFASIFSALGLLVPGLAVLLLALWTTTDNNLYSSSLAFTNAGDLLGIHIPKWGWTLISIGIAVLFSFVGLASRFGTWLGYLGAFTTPFAGILIAHFWIVNAPGASAYRMPSGVRVISFITWIAGFVVCRLITANPNIPIPSAIGGMLTGVIIYSILYKISPLNKDRDSDEIISI